MTLSSSLADLKMNELALNFRLLCYLPVCVRFGFSFNGDAASDSQSFQQLTYKGNALQNTRFHQKEDLKH